MPTWARLLIALLCLAVSFLAGLLIGSMGHGWRLPILLSFFLGVWTYPAAALLASRSRAADVAGKVLGVLIVIASGYLLFEFGMHSYWGFDTRGALGSAELPRATIWAALLIPLAAMVMLSRAGISWRISVLLLAAALSDEMLWYGMTHYPDTWNYRGGSIEIFWLFLWSGWQIVVILEIGRRLLDWEDERSAAARE